MKDATGKQISLRTAIAVGFVKISRAIYDDLISGKLPLAKISGEATVAGKLASKEAYRLIPQCLHTSLGNLDMIVELQEENEVSSYFLKPYNHPGLTIYAMGKSIGRVSIDMEVLSAVSVAALSIYESLKSYSSEIEVVSIKLVEKTGGRADREKFSRRKYKVAILLCSGEAALGKRGDAAGQLAREMLVSHNAEVIGYQIIPEEKEAIQKQILQWVKEDIHFIFTLGGTGLSKRNLAVDAVAEILEREAPGIIEAMRDYGFMRGPLAMMSRLAAGTIAESLVVTLPGSTSGAREGLEAILPGVFHVRKMLAGGRN